MAKAPGALQPVPPERKWRAIAITTIVLVPAFWALLAGLVAAADEGTDGPQPAAAIAFGLAWLPFVFIAGSFLSQHPSAPGAAAKGMGLALLVGIPVSALAGDAVTGLVAGVGAGGIVALRREPLESLKARALAVTLAAVYTFVLVRVAGAIVLLSAPVFPFTAIGIADHLAARRGERTSAEAAAARASDAPPPPG